MNVVVDTSFIDMLIYLATGLGIVIVVLLAVFFVKEYRTPKESKTIRGCSNNRHSINMIATDDGTFELLETWKTGPEGVVETKPEGKHKVHWTGFQPRPGKALAVDVAPIKNLDGTVNEEKTEDTQKKTEQLAVYINTLMTRKTYLKGARIPVQFGVKGKGLLANISGIAGVQISEALAELFEEFHVDITALKTMVISNSYNESQINALEEDKLRQGQLEQQRHKGGKADSWIPILIAAGIFFGGVAAVIAVVKFL